MAATRRASFGLFLLLGRGGAWPTYDRFRPFHGGLRKATAPPGTDAGRAPLIDDWNEFVGIMWERVEGAASSRVLRRG